MRPMPELNIEELSVDDLAAAEHAAAERWYLSDIERALQAMLG